MVHGLQDFMKSSFGMDSKLRFFNYKMENLKLSLQRECPTKTCGIIGIDSDLFYVDIEK